MNRRELIAGATAIAATAPLAAQQYSAVSPLIYIVGIPPPASEADKAHYREEYERCKGRGHTPTVFADNGVFLNSGIAMRMQDKPADPYPNVGPSAWKVCWYCKTSYRFVTVIEGQNTP